MISSDDESEYGDSDDESEHGDDESGRSDIDDGQSDTSFPSIDELLRPAS